MWLTDVAATNYRAFTEVTWTFPRNGLSLVAGANNAGKSSLLAVLDAIAKQEEVSKESRKHAGARSGPTIVATFDLSEEEASFLAQEITKQSKATTSTPPEKLIFKFQEDEQEELFISQIDAQFSGKIYALIRLDYRPQNNTTVLRMLDATPTPDEDPLAMPYRDGPSFAGEVRPGVDRLQTTWQVHSYPILLLQVWRSNYFHFRALRPGTKRTAPLVSQDTLNPTGENLPAVLLGLVTNKPHIMQKLRELISEIVPGVGDLQTPTSGNTLEVAFADSDAPFFRHNLKELGTGVEQLLMTIVVGLTQKVPCTLVVEEPETNLHPAAQRAMLGLLREWSKDRMIVVATHSPVMLDSAGDENIWHVTRKRGDSTLRSIDSKPTEVFTELGVRLSDVLSADRLLLVEGPSDEELLSVWFPEILRHPRLTVIDAGGGEAARHASLLSKWIKLSDRIGERQVLFMRDRDELSESTLHRLMSSGIVHVLDRREIENYLLDAGAISQTLSTITQASAVPIAELNQSMEHAGNSLRPAMIVNRVARRLEPIRLVDHALRQRLAKQNASIEDFKGEVLKNLPAATDLTTSIDAWWTEESQAVERLTDKELLLRAPGADILDAVFRKYANMGFNKRSHAVAVARNMTSPPPDLKELLMNFMAGD